MIRRCRGTSAPEIEEQLATTLEWQIAVDFVPITK